MVGARVRRQQVAYAQARGLSSRRECAVLMVARSTLGYQSRLAVRDAPALVAMRRLAAQYPRYGYRRIRIFLQREGHVMSTDRTHRLWRQGMKVVEVPIIFTDRFQGHSKMSGHIVREALIMVWRLWIQNKCRRRPSPPPPPTSQKKTEAIQPS